MRIGKYNFNWEMPRIVFEKRILSLFNPQIKRKWECRIGGEIGIGISNYCNLKCFSCVSLCNLPVGSNTFRLENYEMDPDTLKLFIRRIEGYTPNRWICFTGGEPTIINPSRLELLAKIVKRHDRKLLLISNGFGIPQLDPHLFDFIRLDLHGKSNIEDIKKSKEHFEKLNYIYYEIVETLVHSDFHKAIENKFITDGLKCPIWLGISLWGETVYPCCCLAQMDGFHNVNIIRDSLNKSGWNVNNPSLKETLENWMETVPSEVIKMCALYCWRGREEYKKCPV